MLDYNQLKDVNFFTLCNFSQLKYSSCEKKIVNLLRDKFLKDCWRCLVRFYAFCEVMP